MSGVVCDRCGQMLGSDAQARSLGFCSGTCARGERDEYTSGGLEMNVEDFTAKYGLVLWKMEPWVSQFYLCEPEKPIPSNRTTVVVISEVGGVSSFKWEVYPLGMLYQPVRNGFGYAPTFNEALQDADCVLRHYLLIHPRAEVLKLWSFSTLKRVWGRD